MNWSNMLAPVLPKRKPIFTELETSNPRSDSKHTHTNDDDDAMRLSLTRVRAAAPFPVDVVRKVWDQGEERKRSDSQSSVATPLVDRYVRKWRRV